MRGTQALVDRQRGPIPVPANASPSPIAETNTTTEPIPRLSPRRRKSPPAWRRTPRPRCRRGVRRVRYASWPGRLLAASCLREAGLTTAAHLAAINLGLKSIPRERRTHGHRETRLLALLSGIAAAAELGLKEHDRLTLARQMMEHRLLGRRQSSKLPGLIDLVLSRPIVSTGMIAKTLEVTPRAALRIVEELKLRELTGRGGFGRGGYCKITKNCRRYLARKSAGMRLGHSVERDLFRPSRAAGRWARRICM